MVVCGVSLRLIAPVVALTALLSALDCAAATRTTMAGDPTAAASISACAAPISTPATAEKGSELPNPVLIDPSLVFNSLADEGSSRCRTSDDSVAQRDTVTEIPENPTWGALLAGMAGMGLMRYRRSRPRLPLL